MAFAYEKRLFFAIHARMPRHHVPASESLGLSLRSEPGGNMRRLLVFSSFFWWTLSLCASQPDAKSLLRDAAAHYRNAQSFRIEFETKDYFVVSLLEWLVKADLYSGYHRSQIPLGTERERSLRHSH